MRTIQVPDIFNCEFMSDFVDDLFLQNKDLSFFSYRFLARKIGCGHSLFADIRSRRRHLPIGVAIDLFEFLGLENEEKQYGLMLIFSERHNVAARKLIFGVMDGIISRAKANSIDVDGEHTDT